MKKLDSIEKRICLIQGRLFEETANRGMDSLDFVEKYMTSYIAKSMDLPIHPFQYSGEFYVLGEMDDNLHIERSNNVIDKEVLFWMGYIYRYWHYYKEISSEEIYKIADFETMCTAYLGFHTLSPEMAIDRLIESHESYQYEL